MDRLRTVAIMATEALPIVVEPWLEVSTIALGKSCAGDPGLCVPPQSV